jgi:cobalamin-dependent methionine synthase I
MEPSSLIVDNQKFSTGRIISADLKGSTTAAFFVCTIGEGFEEFLKPVFESSPAEGFLVDLLGSMIVEAVADYTEEKIIQLASEKYKFKCTNRFSPGYCKWSVEEQHKLFSLFPSNFCGISLSKSALMHPRKSVSGVIGLGEAVHKHKYQCAICDMEHCFRRKNEK